MVKKRNLIASVLAVAAGALLVVSGTRGPVGIFVTILEKLTTFINDALILSIVAMIALFLVILSSAGGFVVIIGSYLIFKNHVGTGKFAVGLGAGAGIPWLLFVLFTIVVTQEISPVIAQHNIVGWSGIILSFIARMVAD